MRLSVISALLLPCFLFSLLHTPTHAKPESYVVYLGSHAHGSDPTLNDIKTATTSHYQLLGSVCKSIEKAKEKIFYSYNKNINGFAAILEEEEAVELAKHPSVLSVFLNTARKLHTTHSWSFLGLENEGVIPDGSSWIKTRFGQDVIIANLDTGVWPELKSFSDEGFGPIPSKWRGICQNDTRGFPCNRKLIGSRFFNKGIGAYAGYLNSTYRTGRDTQGHGSHTLSTAAGNFVPKASVFGAALGTVKGGSPNARVASYKVCWPPLEGGECFDADIMAGFDSAIYDGVDVLSVSVGGSAVEFFSDPIAIGSFHAIQRGIIVVTSAGNEGPGKETVGNSAPWFVSVGASTLDREFLSYVALGNKKHLKAASLTAKRLPNAKFYPLISGETANAANASASDSGLCIPGSLDPKKVKGKILVCRRGQTGRIDKGLQALGAGAVGFILANDEANGDDVIAEPHLLPAAHVSFKDGQAIYAYINYTKNPMAFFTPSKTVLGVRPAPSVAAFSSRGPSLVEPSVLKPDVIAPGVDVIAAYTLVASPTDETIDKRRTPFTTLSGTSMACPHVAGIVGLLRAYHRDWSPAAILSALVTTAKTRANDGNPIIDANTRRPASPFDYGAGQVRPSRALDPGLVYELETRDYLNLLCARGYNESQIKLFSPKPYSCPSSLSFSDFNYPSFSIPNLNTTITATRTVKNVGSPGIYFARVKSPRGTKVSVKPSILRFKKIGESKTFQVTFQATKGYAIGQYSFGGLMWSDGVHNVRSPLVVKHL
ncbi:hypothetical protein K2173_022148 [Erythroxylum novogranatense]|uniref:Uncharacterized protein n=1 Tax=Erythroxylum novogranatense TaxID=1862640 RepID=A0AAV8SU77_9ROSI|nr:hypothetical protein K2173_022148 [Erythroxylum novogranatense]